MNKIIYIFTFLFFISFAVKAQEKKYVYRDSAYIDEPEIFTDTLVTKPIEVKPVDEYEEDEEKIQYIDTALYYDKLFLEKDSVKAIKNQKAFAYVNYLDSLLKQQQPKPEKPYKKSWLDSLFSSSAFGIIMWTLAIAFVLFILYKLFFTQGVFQRNAKKHDDVQELVEEEEITSETNFNKLIAQAEQDNNYRLAIRYYYLKHLHTLSQQGYIHLTADKTNYQYVQEINNETTRNAFAKITLNYEYVWYGEFELDNNLYHQLKTSFNDFKV